MMLDSIDDRIAILSACELFSTLTGRDREAIACDASLHAFQPKATIFTEGDPPEGLWILGSGHLKLHHTDIDGREFILEFPAAGTPLLLGSQLDGRPLTATATALSPATALFLPRAQFFAIIRREPSIAGAIIGHLCKTLRQREIASGAAALKDARARVACRLVQLARQHGRTIDDEVVIDYPISRRDLGRASGITIETAVRTMSSWRRRGIVGGSDQHITVQDLDALRDAAGCLDCLHACLAPVRCTSPV